MAQSIPQAIAAALARGATVLTPTQRAARAIRRAFDAAQQAAGLPLWTPAAVLPLEAWLAAQWHQRLAAGTESRILLNRTQEHALWREIVAADSEISHLRSADALADLAARAWSLLNLHHGRPRLRDFPLSTDSRAFDRWSRTFATRLARAQLITPSEIPADLALNPLPAAVTLVDFDTLPPALEVLFLSLEADHLQTSAPQTTLDLHPAPDDASELQAAAHWTRNLLTLNPAATIAIVVPNLSDRRSEINRIFGPILQPESLPITAPSSAPIYEFSLGRPLAELPLALAALDLLTWTLEPLPLDRITALLLSPWITTPGELNAAAQFDAFKLRQLPLLRPELTLTRTLELLVRSPGLPTLQTNLRNLHHAARAITPQSTQPHTAWADTFRTLLEAAGWSRHASTTSLNFQQHRRWESALDELSTLDALPNPAAPSNTPQPTFPQAIATFTRILRQAIFAPESSNAPVQILGPLELGGIPFDALWFLSADDLTWPPPAAVNPLLPWQLQRSLGLPGADRSRDDALAQTLTTRIAHAASTTIFSFAQHSDEGTHRPSPLLASLRDLSQNLSGFGVLPLPSPIPPLPFETVPEDLTLPSLPATYTGGSRILQLQAACPFRAFAEIRLHAAEPDTRDIGLSAMERGSLVHNVMESFWRDVATQSNLRNLSAEDRAATLAHAVDTALTAQRLTLESPWDNTYVHLERQRLVQLLTPWLETELARQDFAVENPEQRKQFQLGPLTFRLRIDRIDATANGDLILDYKTGEADPRQWQGNRPDQPQIPLYAILAQQEGRLIGGVGFALLRPMKGLDLTGYADHPALLAPGKTKIMPAVSLKDQIDQWQVTLTDLATDFAAGDTRVAPKQYPQTCKRCNQRMLCRLNPDTLAPAALAEDEEADDE